MGPGRIDLAGKECGSYLHLVSVKGREEILSIEHKGTEMVAGREGQRFVARSSVEIAGPAYWRSIDWRCCSSLGVQPSALPIEPW